MPVFFAYFQLGFHHIVSPQATDHLAFLLALCAPFAASDWRRLLALVTSFTIGHSLTLALAVTGWLAVPVAWVEALIPVTVMVTALVNFGRAGRAAGVGSQAVAGERGGVVATPANALALGFGLVHGLGFSNYLRALLGSAAQPLGELFAFNLGVEAGQLVVVGCVVGLSALATCGLGVSRRAWLLAASGVALGVAGLLLAQLR